jgi:hypothetical protein
MVMDGTFRTHGSSEKAYIILFLKVKRKIALKRPISKWDNIKINLKEMG